MAFPGLRFILLSHVSCFWSIFYFSGSKAHAGTKTGKLCRGSGQEIMKICLKFPGHGEKKVTMCSILWRLAILFEKCILVNICEDSILIMKTIKKKVL